MTQTYETKYQSSLTERLEAAATEMKVKTAPTVTKGRLYLNNGAQEERISFSGVSGTTLQNLTRGLSQTAEPATAGTGKTRLAGTTVTLVAMHDQLIDKNEGDQAILEAKVYATTAARDSALGGDGVATKAYYGVYVTATGLHYKYNLSTNQWESIDTGTTTPNAEDNVAGKVRLSTQAQHDAGTTTESGIPIVPQSDIIQAGIQSGSALYGGASAAGSDTYAVSLTPAISAYTDGQSLYFKADVINTGACTANFNSVGAKSIKLTTGGDPVTGNIPANHYCHVVYNSTDDVFVLMNPVETPRYFGDGSDGDVTISGAVTLTRDMYYNNLTCTSGNSIDPAGYRIFVRGTFSGDGTITRNGNNGSNGSGGTGGAGGSALNAGSLSADLGGGAGGNGGNNDVGQAGTGGTSPNPSLTDIEGVAGGIGGEHSGDTGSGGAGGGGSSTQGTLYNKVFTPEIIHLATAGTTYPGLNYKGAPGSGGGGGASGSGSQGGGGGGAGGNGGVIWIACHVWNFTGTVTATGGNGGNGANGSGGDSGGGGGGGGGQGGILFRVYRHLLNDATITLTGGTGGTKGSPAGSGLDNATNGTDGNDGETISVVI